MHSPALELDSVPISNLGFFLMDEEGVQSTSARGRSSPLYTSLRMFFPIGVV